MKNTKLIIATLLLLIPACGSDKASGHHYDNDDWEGIPGPETEFAETGEFPQDWINFDVGLEDPKLNPGTYCVTDADCYFGDHCDLEPGDEGPGYCVKNEHYPSGIPGWFNACAVESGNPEDTLCRSSECLWESNEEGTRYSLCVPDCEEAKLELNNQEGLVCVGDGAFFQCETNADCTWDEGMDCLPLNGQNFKACLFTDK